MGIDFAALSLKDALDLAVLIEEEAKERYEDFAEQMTLHHTPEAARFFRFMAANEEKHRAELSARRLALFGGEPAGVTRGMLFEVEAPEFDEVRVFMSPREALHVAFRAEKKAWAFFVEAAPRLRDAGVKEPFTELREEKVQHQRLVLAEQKTPPESSPQARRRGGRSGGAVGPGVRIVSAAEAVAGIRSRQQIFLHGAACHAVGPPRRAGGARAGVGRRARRPSSLRGTGTAPRGSDGRAHPSPRALHRRQRAQSDRGGSGRVPARLLLGHPQPLRPPAASARCRPGSTSVRPTRMAIARWALPSTWRSRPSGRRARSSPNSTAPCRAPWATGSFMSTTHRPGGRGGCAALRSPRRAAGRSGAPHRRTDRRSGTRRRHAAVGDRRDSTAVGLSLAGAGKKDLGIHTEMFTDVVVDLVERGVVTGARKELNRGKIVSAFMLGTQRLYRFAHDNPAVEMRPTDYTNDSAVIRRFRRMVAVNSAIEIDLTGQVCADSIGRRLYSGVGGQMDFVRGAALAEEGRAIIALPATAQQGRRSRIVAELTPGAGVVTTRAHVQTVVTEFGVAQLHGRSIPERVRALVAIAHPAFREELQGKRARCTASDPALTLTSGSCR
jgi:rubrerythrin